MKAHKTFLISLFPAKAGTKAADKSQEDGTRVTLDPGVRRGERKIFGMLAGAIVLAACGSAEAQVDSIGELLNDVRESQENTDDPKTTENPVTIQREGVEEIMILAQPEEGIVCYGMAAQGGMVICRTQSNAIVEVGRAENDTYKQTADADGILIVGFGRDEPDAFVRVGDSRIDFDITPREYDVSRIDGLPPSQVSTFTEAQLEQIRSATARKKIGFASKVEEIGFSDGFIYPVTEHRKTTNFGAQRILNGEPKRPHFGVDLAAPLGTPILAPADGVVSLADDDMYFEGSLIMIDHGQGLISYYLHNEEVLVEDGQRVTQGQQIGTVGSRGRSTGPHLCWRLKWRGRNLDPELLVNWQNEAKLHG